MATHGWQVVRSRSAVGRVEHTLFSEAEAMNGGVLSETEAKAIGMPASCAYGDFQEWIKKKAKRAPACLRRGAEWLRRVEGLQPFHRHGSTKLHPMALLALHTNHTKHRTPAIMALRVAAILREDQQRGSRR